MEYNPMIEERLDLSARKDTTFNLIVDVVDIDGTAYDFTDYTASMIVRNTYGSESILELDITLTSGTITIEKDYSDMNIDTGTYIYDLKLTHSGNVYRWLFGSFEINPKVT